MSLCSLAFTFGLVLAKYCSDDLKVLLRLVDVTQSESECREMGRGNEIISFDSAMRRIAYTVRLFDFVEHCTW